MVKFWDVKNMYIGVPILMIVLVFSLIILMFIKFTIAMLILIGFLIFSWVIGYIRRRNQVKANKFN